MKKIVLFLIALAAVFTVNLFTDSSAKAQIVTNINLGVKDSLKNTDTLIVPLNPFGASKLVSVTPYLTKKSGTVSGKLVFEQSVDGIAWEGIDSLTLTNGNNYKTFQVPYNTAGIPTYPKYRLRTVTSGTLVIKPAIFKEYRRTQ